MNKTKVRPTFPRPIADMVERCLGDVFSRQGFTSTGIVTHWAEIVGDDIARHCQPMKLQWPRAEFDAQEPGTLVLRVEGPVAIEIQHMSAVIVERVNRFFGWRAVGRIVLRQAPLVRRPPKKTARGPDPALVEQVAAGLDIADADLRAALSRLGAAVKAGERT